MRPIRNSEKFTDLEINQMQTIDNLQEEIKLLRFDNSKNQQKINELISTIERKKETLHGIICELELIQKEKKFERLRLIINALRTTSREDKNE
jgi:hypothetical protein